MRGSTPKNDQTNWSKNAQNILEKIEISGPNGLSKCPESREMDFGPFRGKYFSTIFATIVWTNIFRKNGPQTAPLAQVPG